MWEQGFQFQSTKHWLVYVSFTSVTEVWFLQYAVVWLYIISPQLFESTKHCGLSMRVLFISVNEV